MPLGKLRAGNSTRVHGSTRDCIGSRTLDKQRLWSLTMPASILFKKMWEGSRLRWVSRGMVQERCRRLGEADERTSSLGTDRISSLHWR